MSHAFKKFAVFFFALFSLAYVIGAEEPIKKTICLNMIVKNERPVIERCLNSVKEKIDYWVIVDTGSDDGTQEAIKAYLKDIPGELHERPWVNFGHNRNEALIFAKNKADYIMMIDADEVFEGPLDKSSLTEGAYLTNVRMPTDQDISLHRTLLVKNDLDWKWTGVIHERLICPYNVPAAILDNTVIRADFLDGNRCMNPRKYHKDAEVLETALLTEPENADYVYYLGQSYFNAREYAKSIDAYSRRAAMGGWDQQTFWSLYMVGLIRQSIKDPIDSVIDSYCKAYQFRPSRAEPLFRIATLYLEKGNTILAYLVLKHAMTLPKPSDSVYVENWLYDYGLEGLFADSARIMGKREEYQGTLARLLTREKLPNALRERIISSLSQIGLEPAKDANSR